MKIDDIIILALVVVIALAGALLLLRQRGTEEYTLVEGEATGSDYRTGFVSDIMRLTGYWLAGIVVGEPDIYSNDELTVTYLKVLTENGLLCIAVDWQKHRVWMTYGFHDRVGGERYQELHKRAHIRRSLVPEKAIVNFLWQVEKLELQLMAPFDDLLDSIMTNVAVANESDSLSHDDKLAFAVLALTGYLDKHRDVAVASALTTLIALAREEGAEHFVEILQKYHPSAKNTDSDEK